MKKFSVFMGVSIVAGCLSLNAQDLIGYWDFDENADSIIVDQSDNGNNGVMKNAEWVPGVKGNALYFDGISDLVKINNSNSFSFSDKITICGWVKLDALNGNQTMIRKERTFALGIGSGGQIGFQICTEAGWNGGWAFSRNSIDTEWHHIAGTFDGQTMRTYIDGVEDTNYLVVTEPPMNINSYDIYLGQFFESHYENLQGAIDEVRVYHDVLTAKQLQDVMAGTPISARRPALVPVTSPTKETRPTLRWFSMDSVSTFLVQIDSFSSFSHPIVQITTTDTSFTPLADLPFGNIYWRVAGQAPLVTYYSLTSTFVIIDHLVPVLVRFNLSPMVTRRPEFEWFHVDSLAASGAYTISIDTNRYSSTPYLTISLPDTTFTPLADLPAGKIYWRVSAETVRGKKTSGLDSLYIQPDSIPYITRYNGASVGTARPKFAWKPVTGASFYRIEIDTVPLMLHPALTLTVSDTFFSPLSNLGNRMYYWHVSCSKNSTLFCPIDSILINHSVEVPFSGTPVSKGQLNFSYSCHKGNLRMVIKNASAPGMVTIFTVAGKIMENWNYPLRDSSELLIKGIPRGIYLVTITSQKKQRRSTVIINE